MLNALESNLERIADSGQIDLLAKLGHGIEKEGLRVDQTGQIAQSDHPLALGSTLTHPQITTDYSEALLEFITEVDTSIEGVIAQLTNLHRFALAQLDQEELWCASMPCGINSEEAIRIAEYGSSNIGKLKHIYRVGLQYRYGKMMQTIAGIHYNFSVPEEFWPAWKTLTSSPLDEKTLASNGYFGLIRNFRRTSWLLLYLFGASPAVGKDFMQGAPHQLQEFDEQTLYLPWGTSLRMSDLGYSNRAQEGLGVCFNQLSTYADSLKRAIQTPYVPYQALGIKINGDYRQLNANVLQIENEYYSDIRPKRVTHSGEKPVHALIERGVQYIEVRNTDINPLLPVGIDHEQARFMDAYLLACLLTESEFLTDAECALLNHNKSLVVKQGRKPDLKLVTVTGERSLKEIGREILDAVSLTAQLLDRVHNTDQYGASVEVQRERLEDSERTPSAQILNEMRRSGLTFHEWTLEKSRGHRRSLLAESMDGIFDQQMRALAQSSLAQQHAAEAQPQPPFDQFLEQYLQG